jgi:hypothetical protein
MAKHGKNRNARLLLLLLIVGGAAYVYYTPYVAFENMRTAANNRNPDTLSQYINYPSLRESVRANIQEKMDKELDKDGDKNPLVLISAALGTALVGPAVDRLVRPENLAMMLNGEKLTVQRVAGQLIFTPALPGSEATTSMRYVGFDDFEVTTQRIGSLQDPMTLTLHRENLISWKLTAVKLPF